MNFLQINIYQKHTQAGFFPLIEDFYLSAEIPKSGKAKSKHETQT